MNESKGIRKFVRSLHLVLEVHEATPNSEHEEREERSYET